jgi:pantothenate kinase
MSQIDYDSMSDAELRQYFLQHRHDQAVLEAYFDRLNQRPRTIIASPGDPDFGEKIQAAIRQKLNLSQKSQPSVEHTES